MANYICDEIKNLLIYVFYFYGNQWEEKEGRNFTSTSSLASLVVCDIVVFWVTFQLCE